MYHLDERSDEMNLYSFLSYFHSSYYIPIYLYEKDQITHAVPEQDSSTYPLTEYLSMLTNDTNEISYIMTSYYSYYGSVRINENCFLIIGPVNDFPYTDESLESIQKEARVKDSYKEEFVNFFKNIPTQNWDSFINTLLFINLILNNTELSKKDVVQITDKRESLNIIKDFVISSAEKREEEALYNSFNVEEAIVRFVETGQVNKLKDFAKQARYTKIGEIAPSALRQWKNLFIVTTTLISRAAMRGGLSPSISYQLSNVYLQQVEKLKDIEAVKSLLWQVQIDYATRVSNAAIPSNIDNVLHEIIQYIQNNINQPITVTEIASLAGYTRSSLSRKFKKELGINISNFIKETKLEEAKDLLSFSNESISKISNYLCFSSQSHFQKSFKEYTGITPEKYRKSFWKLNTMDL